MVTFSDPHKDHLNSVDLHQSQEHHLAAVGRVRTVATPLLKRVKKRASKSDGGCSIGNAGHLPPWPTLPPTEH